MKLSDIQNKIKALQGEQAATEKMINDFPAELPEPALLVWHNSKLSEFGMIYKVKSLDEAKDIINAWGNYVLLLNLSKGTFTTFRTPEHQPERGEKSLTPVFPVKVDVSQFNLEFEFYAMVNGHLLSVSVEFEFQAGFERYARVTWRKHANNYGETWVTDVSFSAPAFTGYRFIKWASGGNDSPNSFSLYWESAESLSDLFAEGF